MRRGHIAIEYAMIVALLVLVIFGGVAFMSQRVSAMYAAIAAVWGS